MSSFTTFSFSLVLARSFSAPSISSRSYSSAAFTTGRPYIYSLSTCTQALLLASPFLSLRHDIPFASRFYSCFTIISPTSRSQCYDSGPSIRCRVVSLTDNKKGRTLLPSPEDFSPYRSPFQIHVKILDCIGGKDARRCLQAQSTPKGEREA